MSIRAKLLSAVGACLGAFVAFASLTWSTVDATKVTGTKYQSIIDGKDLVADILPPPEYIIEPFLVAYQAVEERDLTTQKRLLERLKTLKRDFEERHRFWSSALPPGELRSKLLETSYRPAVRFFELLDSDVVPAIEQEQRERARSLLHEKLRPLYEAHRQAIEEVVALANTSLSSVETSVKALVISRATMLAVIAAIVFGAMAVTAFWVNSLSVSIVGRLAKAGQFASAMADGDMTLDLEPGGDDEVGRLIGALQKMKTNVCEIVAEIHQSTDALGSTSSSLLTVSSQTAGNVARMLEMTNTVAAAAEESSASTTAMATNAGQAVANVESVTKSTDEMSATIADIARNSAQARSVSETASSQAQDIQREMRSLGDAAQDIGKVTETIKSISAQTSLLSLNATIEAARAGAAGKGFAVVATEVKELSQQAASATEDIKSKVASVQTSVSTAVSDIERIASVVKDVNDLVTRIATAVEEQSAVTRDVANNISQASSGIQDIGRRVSETATVSESIAHDVAQVRQAAGEIRDSGDEVKTRAVELSSIATTLNLAIGRFKLAR